MPRKLKGTEFEQFEAQIKETTENIQSTLSYDKAKNIGVQCLKDIAKQIPKSFGVKCLVNADICFIDRGETYADTLILDLTKKRDMFTVGAWGDYVK